MNRRNLLLMLGLAPFTAHAAAAPVQIVVYKSESCGCCKLWVQHLLQAGFVVKAHDVDNMGPIK